MKRDSQALLSQQRNLMRFTEPAGTLRDEYQPCARLVNIVGDHDIHRTWLVAIKPVGEFGFDDGAFR